MKAGPRAEKSAETEDKLPKKRLVIQFCSSPTFPLKLFLIIFQQHRCFLFRLSKVFPSWRVNVMLYTLVFTHISQFSDELQSAKQMDQVYTAGKLRNTY